MKNYSKLAEKFFKNNLRSSDSFVPDEAFVLHTQLVLKYSFKIAKGREVNKDALSAACWLHDMGRFIDDKNHRIAGLRVAQKFFEKYEITSPTFKAIVNDCIKNHSTDGKPKTIEGKIIKEADRLALIDIRYIRKASKIYKVSSKEAASTFYKKANLSDYYKLAPELAKKKLKFLRRKYNLK